MLISITVLTDKPLNPLSSNEMKWADFPLSNGEVYAKLSVDPSASVRDALRNPTFNLNTDWLNVSFIMLNDTAEKKLRSR